VVALEKDHSSGDSTHKSVLPKALESRFACNLNLLVTSKGLVCNFLWVYLRLEEPIRLKFFNDP
jgi:hypothetical protein